MASKCDITNTSLYHIRKANYSQIFAKDMEKQLIADGLDDYISSDFVRVDNLYSLDHRIFNNAIELKEKMKSVVKKTRKLEKRALTVVYTHFYNIFLSNHRPRIS